MTTNIKNKLVKNTSFCVKQCLAYQTGQVPFSFNHGLIQSSWKICSQGNSMTISCGSNWSLQTAQSVSVLFSSSVNGLLASDSITCSGAGGGAEALHVQNIKKCLTFTFWVTISNSFYPPVCSINWVIMLSSAFCENT